MVPYCFLHNDARKLEGWSGYDGIRDYAKTPIRHTAFALQFLPDTGLATPLGSVLLRNLPNIRDLLKKHPGSRIYIAIGIGILLEIRTRSGISIYNVTT